MHVCASCIACRDPVRPQAVMYSAHAGVPVPQLPRRFPPAQQRRVLQNQVSSPTRAGATTPSPTRHHCLLLHACCMRCFGCVHAMSMSRDTAFQVLMLMCTSLIPLSATPVHSTLQGREKIYWWRFAGSPRSQHATVRSPAQMTTKSKISHEGGVDSMHQPCHMTMPFLFFEMRRSMK